MDTRFLESFVAVADHGSMAEAARRLGITPAAVAQRIQALESEIGAELLARSGRVVRPTAAGTALIARARVVLRDVRDLRTLVSGAAAAGELRLGAIATAITGLLPGMLAGLTRHAPQVELYVVPGASVELYQKVLDGTLDAALLVEPPFAIPKTIAWQVLREEPLIAIAPGWADTSDLPGLLARESFIRYDRSHWGGRLADAYLRRLGVRPRERLELDALEAIAVLVDRGLGVSLVPDWAPPWPAGLSLNKISLPDAPVRRIGMIWQRGSARARLSQTLLAQAGLDRSGEMG